MKLLPRRFVRDAAYLLPSQRLRGGILLPSPRVIRASAGSPPPADALLFSGDSTLPNSLNKLSALQASCTIRAVAGCIAATGDALIFWLGSGWLLDRYWWLSITSRQLEGHPLAVAATGDRVRSDRLPGMFPRATPRESRPAPVRMYLSCYACWQFRQV